MASNTVGGPKAGVRVGRPHRPWSGKEPYDHLIQPVHFQIGKLRPREVERLVESCSVIPGLSRDQRCPHASRVGQFPQQQDGTRGKHPDRAGGEFTDQTQVKSVQENRRQLRSQRVVIESQRPRFKLQLCPAQRVALAGDAGVPGTGFPASA